MEKITDRWAVTAASHGVFFLPAPGNPRTSPPEVSIRAAVPDGSEVYARREESSPDGVGAYAFFFDRELPQGSIVYLDGSVLYTVGKPEG